MDGRRKFHYGKQRPSGPKKLGTRRNPPIHPSIHPSIPSLPHIHRGIRICRPFRGQSFLQLSAAGGRMQTSRARLGQSSDPMAGMACLFSLRLCSAVCVFLPTPATSSHSLRPMSNDSQPAKRVCFGMDGKMVLRTPCIGCMWFACQVCVRRLRVWLRVWSIRIRSQAALFLALPLPPITQQPCEPICQQRPLCCILSVLLGALGRR